MTCARCHREIPPNHRPWPVTDYNLATGHFEPILACFDCIMIGEPVDRTAGIILGRPKGSRHVVRGEKMWSAKLDEGKVREIRRLGAAGERSLKQIAHRFGVSTAAIESVIHRRSWAHVLDEPVTTEAA